jgi:hypothetical protein
MSTLKKISSHRIPENVLKYQSKRERNFENPLEIMQTFLPSFPSALQLRVSFGVLNNLPPFLSIRG